MEALEKLYNEYLMDCFEYSNYADFDMDMQLTRDKVEKILERGYVESEDVSFLRSILDDIESIVIRTELEDYLNNIVIV